MILIADSGSTKCDWIVVGPNNKVIARPFTMGFNPYFHSEAVIATAIKQNAELSELAPSVEKIFYYGAGCSSPDLNKIVTRALRLIFKNAEILVDHDLLGAAYATYNGSPGISCILGTGSNSCFFDGERVREEVPALGYILGDEGSGSYFGKQLLAKFLYKQLPDHIANAFKVQYDLTMREVVDNVYSKANANVYLASFVRFISDYKTEEPFKTILRDGMKLFFANHVMCYPEYKDVPVHFVGSVAFYYQDAIKEAADELGITVGNIVRKPIDRLVEYHIEHLLKVSST